MKLAQCNVQWHGFQSSPDQRVLLFFNPTCAESSTQPVTQVLAFFAHAYLVVFHSFDEDNLDGRVRAAVPWFIISIFIVEGERERETRSIHFRRKKEGDI